MELFFGIAADGRTYPDAPAPGGAVDIAIVGPAGLMEALEMQFGLARPALQPLLRPAKAAEIGVLALSTP